MKTAIQQAIIMVKNRIETIDETLMGKHSIHHLQQVERDLYDLLKKEKEQIVDACNANLKGLLTNGKDYYDLNFNHHIELEPNTYTNFTPHNANAVAEYNEGLKNFTPNK
jgi:hypothetical protein